MPSRRRLLGAGGATIVPFLAGCLSGPIGGRTSTATEACSSTDPPLPTEAAASPREYPERPAELTRATVGQFLEE